MSVVVLSDRALNTTTLIHEAYLKFVDQSQVEVQDRHHFFAMAAKAMRHILVDEARRRGAQKRGGRVDAVPLEDGATAAVDRSPDLVAVDRALERLEAADPRLGRIVELRRSEEHTSELQSLAYLVCRLLLEKKKNTKS